MTAGEAVDLAQAVAWPLVVVVVLIVYRSSVRRLIASIADRASGFKAGPLSVTFAVATEASLELTGALTDVTNPTTSTAASSDAQSSLKTLLNGQQFDSFQVELGTGDQWLTSRLFLYSSLLPAAVGIRCIVFTETRAGKPHSFVGISDPLEVAASLASTYPWMRDAFKSAGAKVDHWCFERDVIQTAISTSMARDDDDDDDDDVVLDHQFYCELAEAIRPALRAVDLSIPSDAAVVAETFLTSPLIHASVGPNPPPAEWLRLPAKGSADAYLEHAEWITDGAHLTTMIGAALRYTPIEEVPTEKRADLGRRVVAADGDYVAMIDSRDRFLRLLDRRAGIEKVARDAVRQS